MTKVTVLTSVHPPLDTRIFHKECATLAGAGYDVVLVVPHDKDEIVDGVRIRAVSRPQGRLKRMTASQWNVFRAAMDEKADIYHFHDPELIPVGLALKAATRAAVIYDVHEHNPDALLERGWLPAPVRPVLSSIFDRWETLSSRGFDAIITADDDVAARFQETNASVTTLYNFPLPGIYSGQQDLRSRPIFSTERAVIGYVGVMGKNRGLWLMLDTLEILVREYDIDVELVLAGKIFGQSVRQRFEERIAQSESLSTRVDWLGPLPYTEMPAVLARADLGWAPLASIPKFHKNIPTKLFDYMASGLPIVASDLPPIRRFVDRAQAGILAVPEDASSHAAQIAQLIHHPDEARQMGANGRSAFEMQYNWDKEAHKLLTLYDQIVEAG